MPHAGESRERNAARLAEQRSGRAHATTGEDALRGGELRSMLAVMRAISRYRKARRCRQRAAQRGGRQRPVRGRAHMPVPSLDDQAVARRDRAGSSPRIRMQVEPLHRVLRPLVLVLDGGYAQGNVACYERRSISCLGDVEIRRTLLDVVEVFERPRRVRKQLFACAPSSAVWCWRASRSRRLAGVKPFATSPSRHGLEVLRVARSPRRCSRCRRRRRRPLRARFHGSRRGPRSREFELQHPDALEEMPRRNPSARGCRRPW